ncbi:MAG TPA: fatty acid desaturase [Thermoleophilaceae bacterium]|nr:fatty acid desaturase [Thermoleophilaceae bacterium]
MSTRALAQDARDMLVLSRGLVAYNLAYLALAWAVAIAAIAAFWAWPAWYTFALAFLVVSSRQQALLNVEHECVHRKFLPSLRSNNFVGTWLAAAAVGSPFGAAQARHLSHHRLLGSDEDPDRELHSGDDKRTRKGLFRYFAGALMGGYAGMVLMGPRAPKAAATGGAARRDLLSLVVVQGAIALGLTLGFAWWVYPALWLAPLATLTALSHLLRSFVEHAITDGEEAVHGNRLITIRSNLLERALVSPYFMNYHAEHHLLPSVPAPRLRALQHRLATREDTPTVLVRQSYGGAVRHYARALPDD